jgi:hypothetical protein
LTNFQRGLAIDQLLELAEHLYIKQFKDIVQQLPESVKRPVRVRDSGAFASFLGDSNNSFFNKYLVIDCLNEFTYLDADGPALVENGGQRYVSSVLSLACWLRVLWT